MKEWRCFWYTREVRIGPAGTKESGRFQRESLLTEKILIAAKREFFEETGFTASGPFVSLGSIRQKGGKIVEAWAFEGDCDPSRLKSDTSVIEWPPRSRSYLEIPEVDRGQWFSVTEAHRRVLAEQGTLLLRLCESLGVGVDRDANDSHLKDVE